MIHQTTFSYCLLTGQMGQHDQRDQCDLTTGHENVTHINDPSRESMMTIMGEP